MEVVAVAVEVVAVAECQPVTCNPASNASSTSNRIAGLRMPSASRTGKSAGGSDFDAGNRFCGNEAAGITACVTGRVEPICSGMHGMPSSRVTS